jgi:hypothetical protein
LINAYNEFMKSWIDNIKTEITYDIPDSIL